MIDRVLHNPFVWTSSTAVTALPDAVISFGHRIHNYMPSCSNSYMELLVPGAFIDSKDYVVDAFTNRALGEPVGFGVSYCRELSCTNISLPNLV